MTTETEPKTPVAESSNPQTRRTGTPTGRLAWIARKFPPTAIPFSGFEGLPPDFADVNPPALRESLRRLYRGFL